MLNVFARDFLGGLYVCPECQLYNRQWGETATKNHQLQWCPLKGDSGTVSGDVMDGVPLLFCDYIINKELIVKSGFLITKKLWKLSIGVRKMLLRTG